MYFKKLGKDIIEKIGNELNSLDFINWINVLHLDRVFYLDDIWKRRFQKDFGIELFHLLNKEDKDNIRNTYYYFVNDINDVSHEIVTGILKIFEKAKYSKYPVNVTKDYKYYLTECIKILLRRTLENTLSELYYNHIINEDFKVFFLQEERQEIGKEEIGKEEIGKEEIRQEEIGKERKFVISYSRWFIINNYDKYIYTLYEGIYTEDDTNLIIFLWETINPYIWNTWLDYFAKAFEIKRK